MYSKYGKKSRILNLRLCEYVFLPGLTKIMSTTKILFTSYHKKSNPLCSLKWHVSETSGLFEKTIHCLWRTNKQTLKFHHCPLLPLQIAFPLNDYPYKYSSTAFLLPLLSSAFFTALELWNPAPTRIKYPWKPGLYLIYLSVVLCAGISVEFCFSFSVFLCMMLGVESGWQ